MEGKISLETLQLVGEWMLTLEIMLPHSESQRFGRLLSQRKLVAACQSWKPGAKQYLKDICPRFSQ